MDNLRSYILEKFDNIELQELSPALLNKASAAAAKKSEKLLRGNVNAPVIPSAKVQANLKPGTAPTTRFDLSGKKYAQSLKFGQAANPPPAQATKPEGLKPTDTGAKYKQMRKAGMDKVTSRISATAPQAGKNIANTASNVVKGIGAVKHGVESAAVGSGLFKKGAITGKMKLSDSGKQIVRTVGGVSKAVGGPDIGAALAPTPLQKAGQVARAAVKGVRKVGKVGPAVRTVGRAANSVGGALIGR